MRLNSCFIIGWGLLGFGLPGRSQLHPARPLVPPARRPQAEVGRSGTVRSFVPKGYRIYDQKRADLDLDGRRDVLLILSPLNEEELYKNEELGEGDEPLPRLVLLLAGTADQRYRLRFRSGTVIYRYGYDYNFRDGLAEVNVGRGEFSFFHYGGTGTRWARTTAFTYQPAAATWQLSKDSLLQFEAVEPDTQTEQSLLTRHVSLSRFNIYHAR